MQTRRMTVAGVLAVAGLATVPALARPDLKPIQQADPLLSKTLSNLLPPSSEGGVDGPGNTTRGPDIIVGDNMNSGSSGAASAAIGPQVRVGSVYAYGIGTTSCNPTSYVDPLTGTTVTNQAPMGAIWDDSSSRKPVIAQNLFRYTPSTGRIEQIGYSWLKHAFFALSNTLCNSGCQATNGTSLGINCSDPYTASRNAGSGSPASLGPRYEVNPWTGRHAWPFQTNPAVSDTTFRRLRVTNAPTELFVPGAAYFVDTVYISPDDSAFGNSWNNASYRRVNSIDAVGSGNDGLLRFTTTTVRTLPGIYGWRAETGGLQNSSVIISRVGLGGTYPARTSTWNTATALGIVNVNDPNYLPALPIGDGYMFVGSNAIDNGNGTWRYEYAIYNLTSDRSAGGFSVPIPTGATVTNVSIRPVAAHSGIAADDARRNTPWISNVSSNAVSWTAGAPYSAAQPNVNNHIEWGTMWNFSFTANVPPVSRAVSTINFYKPAPANDPGQPSSITADIWGPDPAFIFTQPCYANCDGSTVVPVLNALDFSCFLNAYTAGQAYANCDGSTVVPVLNALDFSCFLNRYTTGCP